MGAARLEDGCEMIEKQEISELARELSLDLHVVEKDYVLGWLLAGIAANPELSENWVFRGGTCLKKCYFETYRFSEDLDFTVTEETPRRCQNRGKMRFKDAYAGWQFGRAMAKLGIEMIPAYSP